jgi:cytochrome c oxidase subunit 4
MTIGPEIDARRAGALPFVVAWIVILLTAGISAWTAFVGLGIWAPVIQFGIALFQTSLLFVLFMRLKGSPSLKWVFAVSGFFWLLFLYGLSMTDYSNRQGWPLTQAASGQQPESHRAGRAILPQ